MKKSFVLLSITISGLLFIYVSSCKDKNDNNSVTGPKEIISYNFEVRPILSDKCFNCHGPDANKREAGLRLDIAAEAYKALQEHPRAHALVPGDPALSELFVRVSTTDTAIRMPPPTSNIPPLSETEIGVIKKWIEQGAKYETHWAFAAPKKLPCLK
ncbi:MAG: c-type cytochrome domain-containing protein [Segetibacter sp.]